MPGRSLLVTGGAGFIGSHIAEALIVAGYDVHIMDDFSSGKRENVPAGAVLHTMDVRDSRKVRRLFQEHRYSVVFHDAARASVARSVAFPRLDTEVNVVGLINILEAGRHNDLEKIVFASSGGVIYGEPAAIPQHEEHPLRPESPYGISKLACENYLRYYWNAYGVRHVTLRYTNVYGPRQNPRARAGVVAMMMEKLLTGQQPVIYGDGSKTRDYIYVKDVVAANLNALVFSGVDTFNIGSGIETDVSTVFRLISDMLGIRTQPLYKPDKLGEQMRSVADISKAKTVLGWEPVVAFTSGLRTTIEWYLEKYKAALPFVPAELPSRTRPV